MIGEICNDIVERYSWGKEVADIFLDVKMLVMTIVEVGICELIHRYNPKMRVSAAVRQFQKTHGVDPVCCLCMTPFKHSCGSLTTKPQWHSRRKSLRRELNVIKHLRSFHRAHSMYSEHDFNIFMQTLPA